MNFELATSLINIPGFNFDVATTNQGLYSKTTLEFTDSMKGVIQGVDKILPGLKLGDLMKPIILEHSTPDSQIVTGGTGDTALAVPKMFYKSRTMHGVTFGGSFVASFWASYAVGWERREVSTRCVYYDGKGKP